MKITWMPYLSVTPERTAHNIAACHARSLPGLSNKPRPKLAIVGGGPSVVENIDELKAWEGDIWVSGSAHQWALANGLDCWFFTIDQCPTLAQDAKGAKRAILATCCDPSVFDELYDVSVEVFDLIPDGPTANHHCTTVTAGPMAGLMMGYKDFTFFGCDSSFREQTHAYHDYPVKDMLRVDCNNESYVTSPSMLLQAEFLSGVIRMAPQIFKTCGDGLLQAMIASQDYDITHGAPDLVARIHAQQEQSCPTP